MSEVIEKPTIIQACGNKPKMIEEFIGRINSETSKISIARMKSPGGWQEPMQTPEFDEYSLVLKGLLRVETKDGVFDVQAGQAFIASQGQWVRYSTPNPEGAEYVAVCTPAFSPDAVHRRAD